MTLSPAGVVKIRFAGTFVIRFTLQPLWADNTFFEKSRVETDTQESSEKYGEFQPGISLRAS